MSNETAFGVAIDGTRFDATSPEVIAYREQYPDVELDAAIGSVVAMHNNAMEATSEDAPSA